MCVGGGLKVKFFVIFFICYSYNCLMFKYIVNIIIVVVGVFFLKYVFVIIFVVSLVIILFVIWWIFDIIDNCFINYVFK